MYDYCSFCGYYSLNLNKHRMKCENYQLYLKGDLKECPNSFLGIGTHDFMIDVDKDVAVCRKCLVKRIL